MLTNSYIKSSATVASKAACYLAADRRIALSGTPIQNKIEDIWALFKFLRLEPVDDKEVFNQTIWNPAKAGDQLGVARLQLVMRCCALRRTKESKDENGNRILDLPKRTEIQEWIELDPHEKAAYNVARDTAQEAVAEFQEQGTMGANYQNVLQLLLRLRQLCNHVDLPRNGESEEDYEGLMDLQVAENAIEMNGLNLVRAQSVIAGWKGGLVKPITCVMCPTDYSECFPALDLAGQEDVKNLKKLPHRPIMTKCLHLYCECIDVTVRSALT